MKTKIDLVNDGYFWLRISGLTADPTPEEVVKGVDVLETMMAEFESRNICTGYTFEVEPEPNTESGVDRAYYDAASKSLAVRLAVAFGKVVPVDLAKQSNAGVSNWASRTAKVKQISPPPRQPRGSGITFRFPRWLRYYRIDNGAPTSCDTLTLKVDGVDFFGIDFSNYLIGDNTITSYTITDIEGGVELLSDQQVDNQIQINAKGLYVGTASMTITVNTTSGRINPEKVYFNITE